jgi:hypothetical protein
MGAAAPPEPPTPDKAAAGWYADPLGIGKHRYWDGERRTVRPCGRIRSAVTFRRPRHSRAPSDSSRTQRRNVKDLETERASLMRAVGDRLRREIAAAGVDQHEVVIRSGVEEEIVAALVDGNGDPDVGVWVIFRIAGALGIEPARLLEGT